VTEPTNWIPGLIAAGVGLSVGIFAAWRLRGSATPDAALTVRDRQAEWDDLRNQLIEARANELVEPEHAHHRYALELRAALLLKELSMSETETPEPSPPANEPAAPARAAWVGPLWGALAMAAILVPVILVQNHASERVEGGSLTGNTGPAGGPTASSEPASAPPMKAAPDPALKPLRDAVEANPEDIDARLTLIRAQIGRRRYIQAYEGASEVLKVAPNHPQAKTFLAIVRIEMGMSAVAVKLLTEALELDPTLVEALIYRGVANMQTGEAQAALDDWAEATKIRPDSAAVLQPLIERAEGMLDGSIKPPQPTGHPPAGQGLPSGHPPTGAKQAPAAAAAPVPPGPPARITVDLADGAEARTGAILFVIARPQGVTAGPPAAVKRLTVGTFPVEVTLTNADMMMGGTLPQAIDVTVRVDGDGDPLTKNDGVRGQASGVIVGGKTASLTLAPVPQKAQ